MRPTAVKPLDRDSDSQQKPLKNRPTFAHVELLAIAGMVLVIIVIAVIALTPAPPKPSRASQMPKSATVATAVPFDAGIGAPLPANRIVAAYGILGGSQVNGPASSLDMLTNYLPQLQQLGQQYAALDPIHPVKLAIDYVINVIQPCDGFEPYCSSFPNPADLQPYIDFCQQHNLLLFLDLQLGVMPVKDAITQLEPLLQRYSFVEVALDTEFHFPDTPQGHAEAAAYPAYLGWMGADEINWALTELARISTQYHLPRKVLLIHQWNTQVLHDKDSVHTNPNVSLVLQSDGFGGADGKLGDYQVFVQQDLWEYGGYKLFYHYDNGIAYDDPMQTPQQVMQLFPQPLFISYQ